MIFRNKDRNRKIQNIKFTLHIKAAVWSPK